MSTLGTQRHIMAMLAPLMGTRVTANVTAAATGGDVTVCKGWHLLRIRRSVATGRGELDRTAPYVVTADTTVTSAGVSVPIKSTLGGAAQTLDAGDVLVWDPPRVGLAAQAQLTGASTVGADAAPGPLQVGSIVPFQDAGGLDALKRLFNAQAGKRRYPCIVVAAGAGTAAQLATKHAARGRQLNWRIMLVMGGTRPQLAQDSNTLPLLDEIESRLVGNNTVDGVVFGQPMSYGGRTLMRLASGGSSFNTAWAVTVRTTAGIPRHDDRVTVTAGGVASAGGDWASTSYTAGPASGDDPPTYPVSGHRKAHE